MSPSISSQGSTTHDPILPRIVPTPDIALSNITIDENSTLDLDEILRNDTEDESVDKTFLSFEEWKKAKGVESEKAAQVPPNRLKTKPAGSTDAIGEEMEIDISNFFSPEEPEGKVYKDKFNFASFDCAATIVKTNSEAKGATSILFENKDSYLLNPCSAPNQFVVIELCQDILVDSVVMGNFEFFSSTFKKVRLSVSETYPVPINGWTVLAEVTANDIRDFQTFNISNPMIWAKYLRVEILEHYGNEYYCPLSVVRVHGRTMMQEYKQEEARQNSQEESIQAKTEVSQNNLVDERVVVLKKKECPPEQISCNNTNNDGTLKINDTIVDLDVELMNNLTAWNDFEECAVTLPLLTMEELFKEFQGNSSCEPISTNSAVNTPSPNPNGGTQESIYKNIMKRLSALESNATLSVLYIEEQSKHISDAFTKLEKRHSKKLEGLMKTFNSTIHSQIEGLSTLYEMVQQKTDDMFNSQRKQHEEMLINSDTRIDQLASDLRFQRMVNLINFIILVCLLVYIIITRDTYIDTEWKENDGTISPQFKQRVMSRSRIKTNFDNLKKYYYNSDAGSVKSLGPSDEEDSGRETPMSSESPRKSGDGAVADAQYPRVRIDTTLTSTSPSTSEGSRLQEDEIKRPLTPDNSDGE